VSSLRVLGHNILFVSMRRLHAIRRWWALGIRQERTYTR
jgi:hypothetical protein